MGGKKDGAKAQTAAPQQSEGKPAGAPVAVAESAAATAASAIEGAQPASLVSTRNDNAFQMQQHHAPVQQFDERSIKLLADTIMPGAKAHELDFFLRVAKRTNLDPFARQLHPVKRTTRVKQGNQWVSEDRWSFQVAIDGFRLIAERTGKYRGQRAPLFCGDDGVWREVWLSKQPPRAAKVGVLRSDFDEPLFAIALYDEYVQTKDEYVDNRQTGNKVPNSMWAKMPTVMLAKVAEAIALRKAFPQEMSGLYTEDEMGQADNDSGDDERAASRRASRTNDGEQAHGGTSTNGEQQDDRNYVPGNAPLFPYGPLKEQGFTLDAKYKDGATVTLKGKKGAADEVVQIGGQYCVKEKRLLEAKDWAAKKIREHHEAEDVQPRDRTEEQKKAVLTQEMYDRFVGLVDDLNAELERRLAEQSAGNAPAAQSDEHAAATDDTTTK
jgi:phage recombination protein Bet